MDDATVAYDIRGPLEKLVDSLLRVGTLWSCGDGLLFEIPPLASDALLTTLHPLLENFHLHRDLLVVLFPYESLIEAFHAV